jgi:putative addiction module killer protein
MIKYSIIKTNEFNNWINYLPPKQRTMILARLDLISLGHFGNHRRFEGLIELKWLNGTRVYTFIWESSVIVVLYGGNKNAQNRDIKKAKKIRTEVFEGARTVY